MDEVLFDDFIEEDERLVEEDPEALSRPDDVGTHEMSCNGALVKLAHLALASCFRGNPIDEAAAGARRALGLPKEHDREPPQRRHRLQQAALHDEEYSARDLGLLYMPIGV
jgi:hypothetical protein